MSSPGEYLLDTKVKLTEGKKFDGGKCRLDLLPFDALWEVGNVYTMGASKYGDYNWRGGLKFSRVFSALLRHAFKWFCGERYDKEDGQHHLSSVVWCGLTLLHYDLNKERFGGFDDRPEGYTDVWNTVAEITNSSENSSA